MITKAMIDRFLKGQSGKEETAEVLRHFDQYPDSVFEYLDEKEWNDFKAQQSLPAEQSTKMWDVVKAESRKTPSIIYYLRKPAVAAAIAIAVAGSWFLLTKQKGGVIETGNKNTQQEIARKTTTNSSAKEMLVVLSDSTVVALMPGSSISYYEAFSTDKRDIILNGGANFSVTKDSHRPFTVYSDDIATTVLGTRFSVKSFAGDDNIRVSLFEGKVVVTPSTAAPKGDMKDMYTFMAPGDILLYSRNTKIVTLKHKPVNVPSNALASKTHNASQTMQGNNWYMFNNQSLAEVFDQLEILYNQKIVYSNTDIKGITFIGKLDNTDSLDNILSSIALINNLKIEKGANGYLVKKK
ncbi:FecR family protein [Pinibacter aurantiacus]|uniref:FecR family protein n=1 Tax=Pinibacter aurantiacus TaxID=2851599 RepID=A0A9E2SFN8_9BACT|nr:FecR family protein [Pinibacter aurantiacus]MBV4360569.1 FecR family protein [Pinibacter aurantiacus]